MSKSKTDKPAPDNPSQASARLKAAATVLGRLLNWSWNNPLLAGIIAGIVMWQHHVLDLARYDDEARPAILIAVVLGIMGSAVATALFYVLIQKSGTLFASLVTYAMPFIAIGWGLLAHEAIGLIQVGCLGLILVGVYVANRN